jgi:predicted AlkP superfamily phosphohydrolase/phosphomutase
VLSNYGFDLKGALNKNAVFGRSIFTGMHTQDDALFFANKEGLAEDVNIVDVMPTVLNAMGVESAKDVDGRAV